jgi:hypothetical protein
MVVGSDNAFFEVGDGVSKVVCRLLVRILDIQLAAARAKHAKTQK